MLFLGTGAAELVPNPFCKCALCERLRREGAVPRKRSAFLVDNELCIDFGPDVMAASQQYNAPFDKLTDILITHTHEDHLCVDNLDVLTMTERGDRHIRLWLSPEAAEWLELYRVRNRPLHRGECGLDKLIENGWISINILEPYRWYQVGNARVFAIRANHAGNHPGELSLNYIVEKGGRRILYAADTGLYSEANLQALRNFGCDLLIMEGTYGSRVIDRNAGHLSAGSYLENAEKLIACGAVKKDAKFYVTHINQTHTFNHADYQAYMNDHSDLDITVALDGMQIQ